MKKAMKQSTLTQLMNMGTIALMALSIVLAVVTTVKNHNIDTANENRFNLTSNANRFMDASAYLTSEVRAFAATGNMIHYNNYWDEVNTQKNRDIGVSNMQAIGLTSEEQDMIDQMSSLSNHLVPLESAAMDQVQAGKTDEAIEAVFGQSYEETTTKIRSLKSEFLNELDTRTQTQIEEMQALNTGLEVALIVMMALVAATQLFSMYVIKKKLLYPVAQIEMQMIEISKGNLSAALTLEEDTSEIGMLVYAIQQTKQTLHQYIADISGKLERMAQGDMTVRIETVYIGEFAPIQKSIETITGSLNRALGQISVAAEQVSTGSDQVSNGSQALAQGATEQASSIEQLSQAISDISDKVQENADNTQRAEDMADSAAAAIHRGNDKMRELTEAISKINDQSAEIGKIIKTIEDIAFQTNILALNAAVEAARAGTAGKGFAVVADEVRNLAGKSGEAAANTTHLIEASIQAVEEGTQIAAATAQELEGVVQDSGQTARLVRQVTNASQEQAETIRQILNGVEQISAVVQNNSATSQESAAAAQELSSQATLMRQLVGQFHLTGE